MPKLPQTPQRHAVLLDGLNTSHPYLLMVDGERRICWVSNDLDRLCGGAAERVGQPLEHWLASEEPLDTVWRRLFDRCRLATERFDLIRATGERVPIEAGALRVSGPDESAVAILRPISEQTDLELQFHHSTDPLRAILDSSPDTVLAIDPNGFVTYANPRAEQLYGHPPTEIVGKPSALLARHDLTLVYNHVPKEGHVCGCVFESQHPDGSMRAISVSSSPLMLGDGTDAGIVVYGRDVTERSRVEGELERKNAELEHYVNAVSHDLRSPLASIRGFAGLLREGSQDDAENRRFVERIEESSRTMEALINDLLELSRIGQADARKRVVNPLAVINRLRAELKPRLDAQRVRLLLPAAPPLIFCDETQLYQIFANLVGNALDHMGECPKPKIAIEVKEIPGWHQLIVRDNGCGIDPSEHERIFEIFQSLVPRERGERCAGIGLAIVKKIAENHGGHVRVISRPGFGATFQVNLPTA